MRTACLGLLFGLAVTAPAMADPILYSTSGHFDISAGSLVLDGVSDASPNDVVSLGSVPVGQISGALGSAQFQVHFQFSGGLPSIDVSGKIGSLGYNPWMMVENPVVSTTATTAQTGLYPDVFQRLLAHPDWLRTISLRNDSLPTMQIGLSVRAFDPDEPQFVPEPGSALVFAAAMALSWGSLRHARRRAAT